MRFFVRIIICPYAHNFLCPYLLRHKLDKRFPKKKFFGKGYSPVLKCRSHRSCTKFFEQNFYQYVTVYLERMWTNKNANEKPHASTWRSKNDRKRIQCKISLSAEYDKKQAKTYCKFIVTNTKMVKMRKKIINSWL